MSRTVRKQLFSTLDTLTKANQLLNKLLINGKTEDAASLLVECQSCAIAIGTQMDEVYGENKLSVHALEDYCELVYQLSENLNSYAQRGQIYQQICEQIDVIRRIMEQEIPDKLEVVFLPYKASMWDSLESVWVAARDDENCDTYVVPIPYFDKNPDGSFGEMHYEGEEIAEVVPIYHWEKIDLEKMRPDVIFFHNPYDEGNLVTSIHPAYYSSKLSRYTDLLIYIPYFVSIGAITTEFCTTFGAVFADRIYVPSELIKNVYERAFAEIDNDDIRDMLNINKVIAAGSPKVDRVLKYSANPEEYTLRDDWTQKIFSETGKRTTILFNTSIGDLLKHSDMYISKMRETFEFFKHNEETILWWRPHPLLKSTLSAMRPELLEEYEKMEKGYIEDKIGIYDDTSDVDRAIALADGYYGVESSSLVTLFGLTGKPILIQEYKELLKESYDSIMTFHDCVEYDEKIYFSSGNCNGLFRTNKNFTQMEFLGVFPSEKITARDLHMKADIICDNIWFSPYNAENICIYNLKTNSFSQIPLVEEADEKGKYAQILYWKNRVYLIPFKAKKLLEINTETFDIVERNAWLEPIKEKENDKRGYIRSGACIQGTKLFMAPITKDVIVQVDLESEELEVFECPYEVNGFHEMKKVKNEFLLLPRFSQKIIKWNPISKEFMIVTESSEKLTGNNVPYIDAVEIQNKIYVIPAGDNLGLEVNTDTWKTREVVALCQTNIPKYQGTWAGAYHFAKRYDDTSILLMSRHDNAIVLYNCSEDVVERVQLKVPVECQRQFLARDEELYDHAKQYRMYEGRLNMLDDFCRYISRRKISEKQKQVFLNLFYHVDGKTSGELIWEDIVNNYNEARYLSE